jgi:hypothetical protein
MTHAATPLASDLARLSDAELAAARERALGELTSRARTAALALSEGKAAKEAAGMAGLSTHPSAVSRLQRRVAPALALLREELRRASNETSESAARWFDELAAEAREAGDRNAARAGKREACLLRGLYPDPRIRVEHQLVDSATITEDEWRLLSCLKHEIRSRLPPAVDAEFTALPPEITSRAPLVSPARPQPRDPPVEALTQEGKASAEELRDAP